MTDEHSFTPTQVAPPKYQLLMELGRGGMGVVHLAMSSGPQGFTKLVVLKMMRKQLLGDNESHRMFLDEARISSRLTHPNIVHVYEVIEFDHAPTLVMEYLEGQTLWSIVRNPAFKLPLPIQLYVLSQILGGLHAAHELRDYDGTPLGLIHRDVSPHNVFVLFDGQVKVLDFGIAKSTASESETRAGELKGKIRYMPPEQLIRENQDRRVDIFAVGVMLWEAVSGRRYWGQMPEGDVINSLLARKLPALPQADGGVPAQLRFICAQALAADPNYRYATAGEFQRDLEDYIQGMPDRAGPDEVGAFLRQHFETERRAARRVIEAHVREAERADPEAPMDGETRIISPRSGTSSGLSGPASLTRSTSMTVPVRRGGLMVAATVFSVVLAFAALVLVGLGHSGPGAGNPAIAGAATPGSERAAGACSSGLKLCDGRCVSIDSPARGCGGNACRACDVANATTRCNQSHRCDVAICYQGFDDCDGDSGNGCETNVRIDPDHCGACGRRCPPLAHAQRGCGDSCTIWRCDSGFRDCNGSVADGCEAAVMNDPANCGQCGRSCRGGKKCRHGECS